MKLKSFYALSCLVCGLVALSACEKKNNPPTANNKPEPVEPKKDTPVKTDTKAKVEPKQDAKKPAAGQGENPHISTTVKAVEVKEKPGDAAKAKGKLISTIGWQDKNGLHAVFFKIREGKEKSLLTAEHMERESDAWSSVRVYRELVSKCKFDIELTPITGKWSVTDIDKNGHGEATFAWRAGCRSDVSSVAHKVLMITNDGKGGDVKYALRGQSRVEKQGGAFKIDPAFKKAPAGFEDHAKKVWKATVQEPIK